METKLVKIGNSRGVRLPNQLLVDFEDDTSFTISRQGDSLVLSPKSNKRELWVTQMQKSRPEETDFTLNHFDENEWEW